MPRSPKTIMIAAICCLLASPLAAQRLDTRKMTCTQAKQLVQKRGTVVLTTGQRTYDRFVANIHFCEYRESLRSRWVPTKDTEKCHIGYICAPTDQYFLDD
ncbi:hypothetical protein [Flexibacterium corallicola]|uniref:hypothetical protein n=1 Tax=Flexibacterium corallicola TaxID=3037259 RepID=UPI00286F33F8|nr:hypothetical protein [Pseudovibrio sp. M1P-2-3]